MFWITNLFGGNNHQKSSYVQKENDFETFSFTVKDLKSWCKDELPALGWQKLKLRISKQAKEKFNFCFDEVSDSTKIPDEILELIDATIFELFNKKFLSK